MGSELPTGTVTFLFTDLEASTRLWEEQPEAMRAALARHDEILREAVEGQRGQIVKRTGDGLHAVFFRNGPRSLRSSWLMYVRPLWSHARAALGESIDQS